MAIRINDTIVANVCKCDCGGDVDCFFDHEEQGWYAQCQQCNETGPTKQDWDDAAHCYPREVRG